MLEIPGAIAMPEEFDKVAIALAGLLRADREGHWDFPGGSNALALYLQCLNGWRERAVQQLAALTQPRDGWNPAAAAVELLAIGCAINGRLKMDADQVADLAALFAADWPAGVTLGSPEMKQVYDGLAQRQGPTRDLLRALCSGSKGGEVGTLVDPTLPLSTLRRIRASGWRLQQTPPDGLEFEPFKRCADLYKRTAAGLEAAATAECEARLAWLDEMEAAFGSTVKRSAILAELSAVRSAFADAGLAGASGKRLDEALELLGNTQFDEAISAVRSLREAKDPLSMLPVYARSRSGAVNAGRTVVETAEGFLDQCRDRLDEQANRNAAQAEAVQSDIAAIERAVVSIADALRAQETADVA